MKEVLEKNLKDLILAIRICLDKRLITPCLILLYSGIDVMAWLNTSESKLSVGRSDFKKWVEYYLLPGSKLNCNAQDIYAARCSMLHTLSAESELSRKGKAKEFFYSWGTANVDKLQNIIDSKKIPNKKAIHIDNLFNAFITAIERFMDTLEKDTTKAETVYKKASKMFCNILVNRNS